MIRNVDKSWLALGIEELGREVAGEVEPDWMVPLFVQPKRDSVNACSYSILSINSPNKIYV